jgi:hypothetical protein
MAPNAESPSRRPLLEHSLQPLLRTSAALTYARRYALFTLVGIAGEDDLDAPSNMIEPLRANLPASPSNKPVRNAVQRPPVLSKVLSVQLREKLLAEIAVLKTDEELVLWAHRHLAAKNTLTADDATVLETAFQTTVEGISRSEPSTATPQTAPDELPTEGHSTSKTDHLSSAGGHKVLPRGKSVRHRNKAHLVFVATQPCLICQRTPCDAHHLKFAQPKALGRKVSDEFTVPLCRPHHHELHRGGNEKAWWMDLQIDPINIAKSLWQTSPVNLSPANMS